MSIIHTGQIRLRTSDSGAGDHGDKGIQTFVDQHECGQRCFQLELQPLKDATEDD
jgi:hypothetical protein